MSIHWKDFVSILLARGVISPAQLADARRMQKRTGARLEDVLVRLGYATTEQIMTACVESLDTAFFDLSEVTVSPAVIELVPESVARENVILPLAREGGVLTVALSDPTTFDTVQKLQFILNRDVRPVLARREQIIDAINRHYGPADTEAVESMLAEFTDTAIDFTQTAFERDAEEACPDLDLEVAADEDEEPAAMPRRRKVGGMADRQATVRYYHRMNPERLFPLLVVLSRKTIQEVIRRGVAQARSEAFRVAEDSVVEVEPVLPGCHCYPPKELVCVGPGEVQTTFWVVPHVLGRLMHARVIVRQDGRTLAEVALEARVVKQSFTVALGGLSLLLPFVLLLLKYLRLDFESQAQEGFGLYAQLAGWLVRSLTPEYLTALLLAATAGTYLWLRPRKRDVFWDVTAAGPDEAAAPEQDVPATDSLAPLGQADHLYKAGDHAACLPLYERALSLEAGRPVHYFRASLAAYKVGQVARALAILKQAETALPASEMKGALWYNLGCFAARLGRATEALRYLDRAVGAGYSNPEKFRTDPDLASLRANGGFKRLLAGIGG